MRMLSGASILDNYEVHLHSDFAEAAAKAVEVAAKGTARGEREARQQR